SGELPSLTWCQITSIKICAAGPIVCHSFIASLISGSASAYSFCACSMIGCALMRRSISALLAGNDFSNCLSCASLNPETWPMSSMNQCFNIVYLAGGFTHALNDVSHGAERERLGVPVFKLVTMPFPGRHTALGHR